jgi:hypothetical protein
MNAILVIAIITMSLYTMFMEGLLFKNEDSVPAEYTNMQRVKRGIVFAILVGALLFTNIR